MSGGYVINTDFSGIQPSDGGQRAMFPVSDSKGWLCMIEDSEGKENSNKNGRILALKLKGLEGAVTGKYHDHTVNLANPSEEAVRIGQQELSAIGHVVGHVRVGNTSEWHGRPFRVVVALEKDQEKYPGSTRIIAFRDQHGNKPSEAGQGALTNPNAAAFQQGGMQGQPQGQNPGNFQQQQPQGQNGGGWGTGQPQGNPVGNPAQGHPATGQPGQGGGYVDPNTVGGYPNGQFNPNAMQGQPQGQPQFDPNAGQPQFNPQQQQNPQQFQGQPQQQNPAFQQGGNGQPSWA